MVKGLSHSSQLRRLLHLLVSLCVLASSLLINVPTAQADDVGGPIDTDTTWTLAGSPYTVVSPVLVMEGVTLTIEPGVTVKFNSHKALQVDGELIAMGTNENPITFTSNVGTNPGDWDYIVFSDISADAVYDVDGNYVSGSILKYVVIEYAGGANLAENNGALRLDAAGPFITQSTIRNNASAGIIGYNHPTTLKLTHNSIMNNSGTGIRVITATYLEITDNVISGNVNSPSSGGGGIQVDGATTSIISRNVIRGNTASWSNPVYIVSAASTTISDNVITENSISDCNPCWNRFVLDVHGGQGLIRNNLIAYNMTGGIYAEWGWNCAMSIIENIIIQNQGIAFYINGYSLLTGTISHNILSDNTTGIDIGAMRVGDLIANISYNSLIRNTAENNAALVYLGQMPGSAINANTIVGNVNLSAPGTMRTVSIQGSPTFNDNNISNNNGYALYNLNPQGSDNINGENNWWGTSSNPEIQALIYDWFDDPTLGIVDYTPYRTEHNLAAPVSPPAGLDVTSGLTSINLSWDANPESDVIGYKIYYDIDDRYPYSGSGADQGASPIDVGDVLTYTLTGLPVGIYHLSVTAYDPGADGAHDQTDGNESWLSVDETGIVGETPNAEFSATPTYGVAPLNVNFTNESSGEYDTCGWDFGDGGTSSECDNPIHVYETPGVYTVTLTVSGLIGTDTETKAGYITIYEPVMADFSGTPNSGVAPLSVAFTNMSSGDYDTCEWDFGDDGTSSECVNPIHVYETPGVYTVTLTVSGLIGTDSETKAGYITIYEPVMADFSGTPNSGVAPLSVAFTNMSSGDYDTCEWDFGDDGTSSECVNPIHVYETPGVYTVTLTVSGLIGTDSETKAGYITIYQPVLADFSGIPNSGVAPLSVDFTNMSSGDYDACEWDFGDGGISNDCSGATHIYEIAGVYTVSLNINGIGGSDELIKPDYITVFYTFKLPLILR